MARRDWATAKALAQSSKASRQQSPQNVLSTTSIEICEVTVSSVSCHHGVPSKAPKAAVLSTTKEICELTVSIVSCHQAESFHTYFP